MSEISSTGIAIANSVRQYPIDSVTRVDTWRLGAGGQSSKILKTRLAKEIVPLFREFLQHLTLFYIPEDWPPG